MLRPIVCTSIDYGPNSIKHFPFSFEALERVCVDMSFSLLLYTYFALFAHEPIYSILLAHFAH